MTEISLDGFSALEPSEIRTILPSWLGSFVAGGDAVSGRSVKGVGEAVAQLTDEQLRTAMIRLCSTGSDYSFFPADPGARAVTRAYMESFAGGSIAVGIERLQAAAQAGPVLLLCNHLAYCDTVLKDMVIARADQTGLADRLIAVAGPKVYETPFRRMASLAIGTIKTAQSAQIAHSNGLMSPRQVAEIAVNTVRNAQEQMRGGGLVVLYGEGSRSRDQRLGPFIKAIRKYAKFDGCQVVPLALSGTDTLMPIGQLSMHAGTATVQVGKSILVDDVGPMAAIESAWHQIAEMLPEGYKPAPGSGPWA